MALGVAAVFWVGARQAMAGHLSTGTIIIFVSYLYSLYDPLESLMYTSSTVQSAAGSASACSRGSGRRPRSGRQARCTGAPHRAW